MVKKFTIWDSWADPEDEDWQDIIAEDRENNPGYWEGADQYREWEFVAEMNNTYLDDERSNLNVQLEHPILVIADLGLWDGRRTGYKMIPSGNIGDILYSQCSSPCEDRWYCDGYDIRCDESHHDGTNRYIYREIRNPENIGRFLDMLYYGKPVSRRQLNYYTRSIATDVARVYGLVREEVPA